MPTLEEKHENAVEAVNQLIALLERCKEYGWASKFYPIKDALEDLEYDRAIDLYGQSDYIALCSLTFKLWGAT